MQSIRERIIEHACIAWEVGNGSQALSHFTEDAAFSVNAPAQAASFVGAGFGKLELQRRLQAYLAQMEVMYYEPLQIAPRGPDLLQCRVHFLYRHRQNSMEIEGSMRHLWQFCGDEVVRLDVFYDACRMRAFYDLAET